MAVASAGPYANNLHLTPDTNTSSLNIFTGQMLFLTTNQQCQSTEGNTQGKQHIKKVCLQLPTSADNVAVPAFAAAVRHGCC